MKVKESLLLVLVLILVAGIAYAKDYEVKKQAGEYIVIARIDKNPPVVGDNNISIEVTDSAGNHARDAKVVVEYSMPAMPGMPAMNYKASTELKGEEYKGKMSLSMAGSWNIAIKVSRGGKTSTMKFTVDAT